MNVALFSDDESLVGICRDALTDVFDRAWTLRHEPADRSVSGHCDLCIWDYAHGKTVLPDSLDLARLRDHWFLIKPNDLSELQSRLGTADLNVLLKPVNRSVLRAFLAGAESWLGGPKGGRYEREELRTERDSMLQFLIQANLKLQEYDQERSNFLARSLHDFRAPLTAISGYCGLLLEGELGSLTTEQREALERMGKSATRLARISNAMFQLSIPPDVEKAPKLEAADIRDCVAQALHELASFLGDKHISVAVDVEPAPEGLLFEKAQLEQTLVNLLDNACKFTPRDGTIEIKGYSYFWERRIRESSEFGCDFNRRQRQSHRPNAFRIDIHDSGPGISPEHAETVFEEYTSYGGGQDRSGGGLGLAICRMILRRHKGNIWAESSPTGTAFSFVIPLLGIEAGHISSTNGASRAPKSGLLED